MARSLISPLPPSLPPLRSGALDLLISITHLSPTTALSPLSNYATTTHATHLLSFLRSATFRQHLRSLGSLLPATRFTTQILNNPTNALVSALVRVPASFCTAVLALPAFPPPQLSAVQNAIRTLRCSHHLFTLIIAVGANPAAYASLDGLDGWIRCGHNEEAHAAAQVFTMLCTLTSPKTLNCIDDTDVAHALGTSKKPSHICEALWLSERNELVWLDQGSAAEIARCTVAIAFSLAARPTLQDCGAIYRTLRALAPPTATVYASASTNFVAAGITSRAYPVLVLYRS